MRGLVNTNGHLKKCSRYGKTPSENAAARGEAAARKTERAPIGTFFPVECDLGALEAFQRMVNEGFFAGEKQEQVACEYEEPGSDVADGVVQCSNISPPGLAQKTVNHCPTCDRDQKKTVLKLCVLHAVKCWGGKHPAHLQTRIDLK